MAELFADPSFWKNNGQQPAGNYTGNPEIDRELDLMPEEERQAALAEITAPPTGEEVAGMIQSKLAIGERPNVTREEYRLYKAYTKTKETDILEAMGQGAEAVWTDLQRAAGSMYDKPVESVAKLTPSLIEAFSQGTRNLYGMLAESQDPNSTLFRVKNAIYTGGDEESEYNQFMDALDFNAKSNRLMQGKETLVMDKDLINPEMTQAMSYVADPTLFIPFGGVAAKGASMIGMAEGLAKASARASAIKQMVIGNAVKWGVGAPIEFLGGATRATIDGALERGSMLFEKATGISAKEAQATARMSGLGSVAAEAMGQSVNYLPEITEVYVGATAARGFGEAIGAVGDQMLKGNRGVRSYARMALKEAERGGIQLSDHAKGLLKVIDTFDPMFSYTADVTKGATHGMAIGGTLGFLGGGEEGMASGIGAGVALGGVGALGGRIFADLSGATRIERTRITTDMIMNGLRDLDPVKYKDFETLRAVARAKGINIDGYIAGFDTIAPELGTYFKSESEHSANIKSRGFDPATYDGSFIDENGRRLFSMEQFRRAEGFVIDKGKDGKVLLGVNLDNLKKNTVPHEAFHAIFRTTLMQPEFQRRMTENVLGVFDKDGKMVSPPKVAKDEAIGFFQRYLNALYKGDELKDQSTRLKNALDEYYKDGQTTIMDRDGKTPYLAAMAEEFGAYYFTQFIEGKPIDYLYLGGKFEGMRGLIETAKEGWLDYWESRTKSAEPRFDINNPDGIDYAFKPKGGKRVRVSALDYMMRDLIRSAEQTNREGRINLNSLSPETRERLVKGQGLDGVVPEKRSVFSGRTTASGADPVKAYNKKFGPEVYKAILALPDSVKPRMDGEGNFVGPLSKEVLEHIVNTGLVSREMANKISMLQDMASGKLQTNIAEMGYVGWSKQVGTGPNPPRVYGDAVPYKRRKVLVLGVDTQIGKNGMSFTARTLDMKVIESRANNLWANSVNRALWKDNRTAFVQDFFRYLENASKTDAEGRVPSAQLWTEEGAAKRDVMHQMAGIPRREGDTFVHAPIAEIHQDIYNSVMNLTVNRMTDIRTSGDRVTFNPTNADPFIRVNMKVEEMPQEKTPEGRVYRDSRSGFKFHERNGVFSAYDKNGELIGNYSNIKEAERLALRVYERQQAAMKRIGDELADGTKRGVTWESRKEFSERKLAFDIDKLLDEKVELKVREWVFKTNDRSAINYSTKEKELGNLYLKEKGISEKTFRDVLIDSLEKYELNADYHKDNPPRAFFGSLAENKADFEMYLNGVIEIKDALKNNKKLDHKKLLMLIDGSRYVFEHNINKEGIADSLIEFRERLQESREAYDKEYESQFPNTFRSRLLEKVQALHKQNPNITYPALIKKILRDSSQTYNFWAESEAIGLVDFLRSKIDVTTKVQKIRDAQGNWTGGIKDYKKGITQEVIDIMDVENYIKDKAITLTPEIGAQEVTGYNTYGATIDGAKSAYNETALRISGNEGKYEHGVRGHYGEAVVHHRSTLRPDINGEPIRFIEEIQANNAQEKKITPQKLKKSQDAFDAMKEAIGIADKQGIWAPNGDNKFNEVMANFSWQLGRDEFSGVNLSKLPDINGLPAYDVIFPILSQYHNSVKNSISAGVEGNFVPKVKSFLELIQAEGDGAISNYNIINNTASFESYYQAAEFIKNNKALMKRLSELETHGKRQLNVINKVSKIYSKLEGIEERAALRQAREHITNSRGDFNITIQDKEINIQQMKKSMAEHKPFPFEEISEWSSVAIKDIIRQAVMNGEDKLALTHGDDTPALCGMEPDARTADYGRIFPDVIRKIVEPYGIEVRVRNEIQNNALKNPELIKATDEKIKAQQAVMEEFKKTQGAGEDPSVISELSLLLSKPVHEIVKDFDNWKSRAIESKDNINNQTLADNINEAIVKAEEEADQYNKILGKMERNLDPSALAIDRATSFTLNKEIKEAVRSGELFTQFKPEDEQGGRTYTSEQMAGKFIGRYASENPNIIKGRKVMFSKDSEKGLNGGETYRLSISKGDDYIGYINVERIGDEAHVEYTQVDILKQGKGYGNLLYSEMVERLRALGVKEFTGAIVDESGRPQKIRRRIIDSQNAKVGGGKTKVFAKYGGMRDVESPLIEKAYYKPEEGPSERFMPADYQGGDDYWKPKKNIFERKDEQGFLIRRPFVGNEEITGDKNARGGKENPESISWESIGHYSGDTAYETDMTHQQAETWEANNMGLWYFKRDKGIKLRNPMDFDDPSYTHGTWFDQIESQGGEVPSIWGRYEKPIYDKKGNLTRRGRISVTTQYRGQISGWADAKSIKEALVKSLKSGTPDEYDAYMFDASDSMKNDRGYSTQDTLPIRFKVDDEVKRNLRSLQSAIDRQSDKDKIPAKIRAGVGRLIQAVERQHRADIKEIPQSVKEGFRALADAVDAQADMDKVPAGVRKGLRLLFEAAQYEDLKPQQAMPKPTASEEQLASGIEALGRAVGVKGQVRRQPSPQAKPEPTAAMPEAKSSPAPQPTPTRPVPEPSSTAWMSWTQEKTETGGFIKNAIGYVIVVNKGKFKVYNPAKALIGIYEDEAQAKRRVLKDMPRR